MPVDRQNAVEHRLQVPRRVGKLHDENVLAQSAALPGNRQSADAKVLESAGRGRGPGFVRRLWPEVFRQTVFEAAQTQTQVGAGRGRAENHRTRLLGTVAQLLRSRLRHRVVGHVRPVL